MKPGKSNKLIDVLKKPQRFEDVRLENIVETIHTPSTDISKDTRPRTVHECLMVDSGGTDPPPLEPKHDDICHGPNLRHYNRGLNIHKCRQGHFRGTFLRHFRYKRSGNVEGNWQCDNAWLNIRHVHCISSLADFLLFPKWIRIWMAASLWQRAASRTCGTNDCIRRQKALVLSTVIIASVVPIREKSF